MKNKNDRPDAADPSINSGQDLRRQAEAKLGERKKREAAPPATESDTRHLVQELEVHQIELEMQNEELLQSRAQVEAGLRQYTDLYDFAPVGYFVLARDGAIHQVNLAGANLLGVERGKLIKRRFGALVSVECRSVLNAFLEKVFLTSGSKETCEVALQKDGSAPLWAHIEATWSVASGGEREVCHAVVSDISECKRTEEALRESEERYRSLIEAAPDVVYTISAEDGSLTSLNLAFERLTGWSRAEWLGKPFMGIVHPDDVSEAVEAFQKALQGEALPLYQLRILSKSGEYLVGEFTTTPFVKSGKVVGELGIARDITERKQAEEELALLAHTIRSIGECVSVTDQENKILFVNDAFLKTYGYKRDELLGKPVSIVRSTTTKPAADDVLHATLQGGWQGELVNRKKDGTEFPIALSTSVVRNKKGQPIALVGIATDITERKRAERKLAESESHYKDLVENSGTSITVVDWNGTYQLVNKKAAEMLGKTPGEVIGQSMSDFLTEETTGRFLESNRRLLETSGHRAYEDTFSLPGGERLFLIVDQCLTDTNGHNFAIQSSAIDITECKRAEGLTEALFEISKAIYSTDNVNELFRHIHRVLSSILQANNFFIALLTDDGETLYFPYKSDEKDTNDWPATGVKDAQSLTVEVLKTKRPVLLDETELLDHYATGWNKVRGTAPKCWLGVPLIIREQVIGVMAVQDYHKSGAYTERDVTLFESAAGQIAIAIERKRAEDALRESEHRNRTFLDSTSDMAFLKDDKFRHIFANRALCKFYGKTGNEIKRKKDYDLMSEKAALRSRKTDEQTLLSNALTVNEESIGDRCYETVKFPVEIAEGKVGVGGYIRDITERKQAKDALRMSEERFRSEFKGNPIPAYIWQKVGDDFVLVDFNTAAEAIMHSNINPLRGVKASAFYSDRPDIIEELSRCCTEGCTIHREMLYTFPSTRENKFLSVSYVFIPSDEIVVYAEDITERKLAEQQLKTSQDQLRALAAYLQNVREDERITIAREIHDELGQVLTVLKMDLSLLEKTSAEQGAGSYQKEVSAEIKEMSSLVGSAIQTVRRLVKELRPEMLDILGLVAALRWQAEQFQQHTRIHCELSLPAERVTLDPGRSIALFRILQESLTNVARHSKATTVLVKLVVEPEAVVLEIKDNGQGISETAMTNARSFGISGMRERAISFGGNVEVRGIPGKGTVVTARIQRG